MASRKGLVELKEESDGQEIYSGFKDINDKEFSDDIKLRSNKRIKLIIIFSIVILILVTIIVVVVVLTKKDTNQNETKDPIDPDEIPIIIDVDEGGDDMVAYIVANNSRKFKILGVTTVTPSYYIDNVTDIWLRLLDYMNFDNKIYSGEEHPLQRPAQKETFHHDYQIDFPLTNRNKENESAVNFMINTIKNYPKKVTLFLLAPLTNFAKAFQMDKSIINNIKEIIIMGGTKGSGNMPLNPHAEYNIYQDAEAANIVFNCGVKIKVFGTDVTNKIEFTDEIYKKFMDMKTKSSYLTHQVMKGTFLTWGDNILHDPVTFLYYLNNDIIQLKDYYCIVNTSNPDVSGTNYGTIHFFEPDDDHKANIQYSENINTDLYWKTLEELVKKY